MSEVVATTSAGRTRLGIALAAGLLTLGNVASRLLGLVREGVIAALFGASGATSAFVTASRVSTAVYDLLISGAISAALVPVFSEYVRRGEREELGRVTSTVLNLALLALAVLATALLLLAAPLVELLGTPPGSPYYEETLLLTRVALPSVLCLGLAGLLSAVAYAHDRFALPAFSTASFNLGIIVGALALHRALGVASLAVGLLVGAALQAALQLPTLRLVRYRPVLDLAHPGVRAILRLYAPVAAGLVVSNAGVVIDTNLAWRTGEASIAAMRFATTLVQLPLGLIATATSLAVLPTLSRHAATSASDGEATASERAAYLATLRFGIRLVLLLMVPVTVGLVVLREPVVALLFERHAFDAHDTALTSLAFLAYAPQLPLTALDQLLIVAYYARRNTLTPVAVGVVTVGLYLATALALVGPLGMPGLALANAAQNGSHGLILLFLLRRTFPELLDPPLLRFAAQVCLASAVAGGVMLAALAPLSGLVGATAAGKVALLAVLAGGGGASYLAVLGALGVRELDEVAARVRSRRR